MSDESREADTEAGAGRRSGRSRALGGGRHTRRGPRPATPERLEKAAMAYVERYAATAETLRRVLMRRVRKSAALHDTDPEAGAEAAEAIVARYARAGLVDDAAVADARARGLARRGDGLPRIRAKLAAKGIDEATAEAALAGAAEDGLLTPLAMAAAYARRRRLGPWRGDPARRAERR
ncbi:MAG: RecX family transcriptional regulator, partial [Azospirillaceae bacterium]